MSDFKLVCFDIDGTLVDGNSWLILAEGLDCSPKDAIDIYIQAQMGKISFSDGAKILTDMYKQNGKANKTIIKDIFKRTRIKKEAENLICYLKKKGYLIYLISGAIDIYSECVAKTLNVNGYYANSSLKFNKEGTLQSIIYQKNQGKVKCEQLKELVINLGIDLNQVVYIGDGENDIDLFKMTKHGITFYNSCKELRRISWRTVNSLVEIKQIL